MSGIELSSTNLADKLGRLIDLSDSVMLSEALRALPRAVSAEELVDSAVVRDQFLQARQSMVKSIASSFTPGSGVAQFKLPSLAQEVITAEGFSFKPYQKFYTLHQSELDVRIIKLRITIRQAVAGHSRKLAQLAALDAALGDTLAAHSRKLLGAIPRLLGRRFEFLLQQQSLKADSNSEKLEVWAQPGGWLFQFHREMQSLLLAELELRLQPIMGLIEALDVEIGSGL